MTARTRCKNVVVWRRNVLAATDVGLAAKVVAFALHEYMTWRKGSDQAGASCYPGLRTIAANTGLGRRTVTRALDELEAAGFIIRERGPGGDPRQSMTRYAATLPDRGRHAPGSGDDTPPVDDANDHRGTGDIHAPTGDNGAHNRGRDVPRPSSTKQGTFPSSTGATPNGDRPRAIEDLYDEHFDSAFQLGKRVADVIGVEQQFVPEQFRDLAMEKFDFADERHAWAGFHRYRCQTDGYCRCNGDLQDPF